MPKRRASARPRRRRDAAATREAILEAATRRFATQGYEHAGVREIAADAGVTAALVNRYFGSKEGLFAEVIERALDMGHLLRGQAGEPGRPPRPGRGVRAGGRSRTGCRRRSAPAAFRRGARRGRAVPAGPRPHRASAPRRADRRRRRRGPGRHGHGTAHGVRDRVPRAPPQGVRGRPRRRAGGPPVQRPSPPVSSEAPRVRLRFVIPRTHGFGCLFIVSSPGNTEWERGLGPESPSCRGAGSDGLWRPWLAWIRPTDVVTTPGSRDRTDARRPGRSRRSLSSPAE